MIGRKNNLYLNLFPKSVKMFLFTDIDDTLWINDRSQEPHSEFNQKYYNYFKRIRALGEKHNLPIIPVTGRNIEGMMYDMNKALNVPQLGDFPIMILSLGTEIWIKKEDKYYVDEEYSKLLSEKFDKKEIYKSIKPFIEKQNKENPDQNLEIQIQDREDSVKHEIEQKYKLSLNFECTDYSEAFDLEEKISDHIKNNLDKDINVVISHHSLLKNKKLKLNLDIVAVKKSYAIDYLKKKLNSSISIVAGDSGNDWDVITGGNDYAIVVGGMKKELMIKIDTLDLEKGDKFPYKFIKNGKYTEFYIEKDPSTIGLRSILKALDIILPNETSQIIHKQ